jgi:hypothetical protein
VLKGLRSVVPQGLVSVAFSVATPESDGDGNTYDTLGDALGVDFWTVDT